MLISLDDLIACFFLIHYQSGLEQHFAGEGSIVAVAGVTFGARGGLDSHPRKTQESVA